MRDEVEAFGEGLRHEQPVDRVAVQQRQSFAYQYVTEFDSKNTAPLRGVVGRLRRRGPSPERVLGRDLPQADM